MDGSTNQILVVEIPFWKGLKSITNLGDHIMTKKTSFYTKGFGKLQGGYNKEGNNTSMPKVVTKKPLKWWYAAVELNDIYPFEETPPRANGWPISWLYLLTFNYVQSIMLSIVRSTLWNKLFASIFETMYNHIKLDIIYLGNVYHPI